MDLLAHRLHFDTVTAVLNAIFVDMVISHNLHVLFNRLRPICTIGQPADGESRFVFHTFNKNIP